MNEGEEATFESTKELDGYSTTHRGVLPPLGLDDLAA
jgi:hypothetical protein